jgi:hypothetical protein
MQDSDFPALYQSTNDFSLKSQSRFFRALKIHLLTLIFAALLSVTNIQHWSLGALQLISLLGALACSIFLFNIRPERAWYGGRAVAESIKTLTWRYVSRAEPFQLNDASSDKAFYEKIKAVIEQNKEVCRNLTNYLDGIQITAKMRSIRSQPLEERKKSYIEYRVNDQHQWYTKKSRFNRIKADTFFWILITINACAILCAILRLVNVDIPFWPTDVFVAMAAGVLSWMQAKKFSELAASYALASYEIGIIKEEAINSINDGDFSVFVGDAENAFSREHTQWVARKDV